MNGPKRQLVICAAIGIGLPLVLTLASLSLHWLWRSELPSRVAVHWNTGGPNLFAEFWVMAAATACFGFLMPALITALLLPSVARGKSSTAMVRLMTGVSLGTSVLVLGTQTGALAIQRGLEDAQQAPGVERILLLSLGLAVVISFGAAFLVPKSPPQEPLQQETGTLELGTHESVMWTRSIHMTSSIRWVLYISVLIALISTAATAAFSPWWSNLMMSAVVLLLLCAVLTGTRFTLRIDAEGLALRSVPLGWPSVRVSLDEITEVRAGEVSGLSEFGGWGLRMAPGARGIILQDGAALRVERRDKPALVVTVDEAAEAADVLASLMQRMSESGSRT